MYWKSVRVVIWLMVLAGIYQGVAYQYQGDWFSIFACAVNFTIAALFYTSLWRHNQREGWSRLTFLRRLLCMLHGISYVIGAATLLIVAAAIFSYFNSLLSGETAVTAKCLTLASGRNPLNFLLGIYLLVGIVLGAALLSIFQAWQTLRWWRKGNK